MTSIDRTAYPTFKRLASRDLADAFTPWDDEIEWARDRSSTDAQSRLDGPPLGLMSPEEKTLRSDHDS